MRCPRATTFRGEHRRGEIGCLGRSIQLGMRGNQEKGRPFQLPGHRDVCQQPNQAMLGVELGSARGTGDASKAELGRLAGGSDPQLAHVHQAAGPHVDHRRICGCSVFAVEPKIYPRSCSRRFAARLRRLQIHVDLAQGACYPLVLVVFKLLAIDTVIAAFFTAVQNQHRIVQRPFVIALGCCPRGVHGKQGASLA